MCVCIIAYTKSMVLSNAGEGSENESTVLTGPALYEGISLNCFWTLGDHVPFMRRKTDRAVGEKIFLTGCEVIGGAPTWNVRVCVVVSVMLNV